MRPNPPAGVPRDDGGKLLPPCLAREIWRADPFASLDQDGVGQLVEMGTRKGRSTRPDLKVGICGEHGGDPPRSSSSTASG